MTPYLQGLHATGDMAFRKDFEALQQLAGRRSVPDVVGREGEETHHLQKILPPGYTFFY